MQAQDARPQPAGNDAATAPPAAASAAAASVAPRHGSAQYATRAYWDARFATERHYEWLCEWGDVAPLLAPLLARAPAPAPLWVLGTGTSALPAQLAAAFPAAAVLATDYSAVLIASLQAAAAAAAPAPGGLAHACADMTDLQAALGGHAHWGRVEAVLDKGALDALVSAEGDCWEAAPELLAVSARVARGVHAALRPGGRYVMLSFSQPHFRARHLLQRAQGGEVAATPSPAAAAPVKEEGEGEDDGEWERDLNPSPVQPAIPPVEGSLWSAFEWHRVERGLGIFLYICTK
jgi:SAM-dependent methyltransferase